MRLGLIGTGKQGQRYLEERNGGKGIVSTFDWRTDSLVDWLCRDRIDAVIVASHPGSHPEIVRHLLELRRPVLCEKPLALTPWDCKRLCDLALEKRTVLEIAHTHLWSEKWSSFPIGLRASVGHVSLRYTESHHDYSPWLDWGPHAVALLEDVCATENTISFEPAPERKLEVTWNAGKRAFYFDGDGSGKQTPMFNMVQAFKNLVRTRRLYEQRINFNRRVYQQLFDLAPAYT